jgi:hypothetical protein
VTAGGITIPSARVEFELFLRPTLPGLQLLCEQGWIDTGAPLSIIPFHVHHGRLDWKPAPGAKVQQVGERLS